MARNRKSTDAVQTQTAVGYYQWSRPAPADNKVRKATAKNGYISPPKEKGSPANGDGSDSENHALKAISHGSILKGIPHFDDFEEKRHWQLCHMAAAFRYFSRQGYVEGMSGHISVRDPEKSNAFWMNPLGVHFGLLKASDMVLVDMTEGELIGGNLTRPINAAGYYIHRAAHLARPDVHAACHAHGIHGRAYSVFAKPLEMITQDVCNFYHAHSVYDRYDGIVFGEQEGINIAEALGPNKGCILRNHGLLTVGHTVDEAAFLFGLMERSCQIQLLADAAESEGKKKVFIADEEAAMNFKDASDPQALYCEFQGEYDYELEISQGALKN